MLCLFMCGQLGQIMLVKRLHEKALTSLSPLMQLIHYPQGGLLCSRPESHTIWDEFPLEIT